MTGGLASEEDAILMPTITVEVKPAHMVQDLKNGSKQYYKGGPKKGELKMKVKTPAKTRKELDLPTIFEYFSQADTVVFEHPGTSAGNAARATASTNRNYGKLLACAELAKCATITVAPHKWKKDLGLSKDKLDSVKLAESISGMSFRTPRGALVDGPAEAYLIGHWFRNYYKE